MKKPPCFKKTRRFFSNFVINLKKEEFSRYKSDFGEFFEQLGQKFPQIKGVSVNFNSDKTNKIIGDEFICAWGENFIYETLESADFKRVYKI